MKQYPPAPSQTPASGWPPAVPVVFWAPTTTLSPEYLAMLAVLLLICAALFLQYLRRAQKRKKALPLLQRSPVIQRILQTAAHCRTPLDMVCARPHDAPLSLRGVLTPDATDCLHIQVQEGTLSPLWENASVRVFFHFLHGRRRTFYHFSSTVLDVRPQNTADSLCIAFPQALTHDQRRGFVRVTPEAGMVEGMGLWACATAAPATAAPSPQGTGGGQAGGGQAGKGDMRDRAAPGLPDAARHLPGATRALGHPPFSFRPPRCMNMTLANISASGALVRLHTGPQVQGPQVQGPPFCEAGRTYVLLLILEALKEGESLALWLAGTCPRTYALDPEHTAMALQFSHWCAPGSLSAPILWTPVEQEGEVPPLLRWTGRVHVLLNRQREQESA